MTKRAVLYARVSGDDRHREDRNLIGQLDMCREYALQHGYEIVDELAEADRGASGADLQLPQLIRVRDMARTGAFDLLVVREIDRLSRSLAKQLFVEEELRRHGVSIEYVLGEYADTPEGNLMKNLRASIAEFERLKISERMVRGRELSAKSGSVMVYARPPFGYAMIEHDGKRALEIYEPQARVVRLIFDWYTVGDGNGKPLSMYQIQKKLTEMRAPTYTDERSLPVGKKREYGEWGRASIGASWLAKLMPVFGTMGSRKRRMANTGLVVPMAG